MTDRSVVVRLRADIADYQRKMAAAGATTAGFVKSLDTADSRMGNLVQTALALTPALVPIGGAGVAGLAGLTTQLGFAAAGAGTLLLGFNGVGEGLKALREYELDPTAENFAKLQDSMRGLGPEAQEFVVFLDDITPKLQQLREESQEALPGFQTGIDDMLERLPQLRDITGELAGAAGDIAADTGGALASEDWDEFFDYLEDEARPNLIAFADTVGNVFEAAANTWMAFDPASDMFTSGLLDWTEGLADSTENLDESEGFQRFLDYVVENTPQAVDTLGALGGAAASLVEAAAPVGAVALPVIETLADTLSVVAESPAGPVLIAAAAGLSAVSRSIAVYNAANGSALMGLMRGTGKEGVAAGKGAQAAGSGLAYLNDKAAGIKTGARIGVAAIGSLALAYTDVDDKAGLTNTAMLGTMGLMAGPWGAAIGAGAGLVMDFAAVNDDAASALDRVNAAIEAHDYSALTRDMQTLQAETGKVVGIQAGISSASPALGTLTGFFLDEEIDRLTEGGQAANEMREAYAALASDIAGMSLHPDAPQVAELITQAKPALDGLKVTADEIEDMSFGELDVLADRIREWQVEADSAEGRTRAFATSVRELGNDYLSTATSADAMSTALEALLAPALNAEEATDAWRQSLATLRKELKAGAGFEDPSAGAMENRSLSRDYMSTSMERLTAMAELTETTEKDMARAVAQTRSEFIKSGEAAGFSRKEMVARARAMGLTPKLVRTVFKAAGVEEADLRAREFRQSITRLPKRVRTELRTEGVSKTMGEVDRLVKKYNLTEKERRALVSIKDLASKDLQQIMDLLDRTDRKRPNPKIDAETRAALSGIGVVDKGLKGLDNTTARPGVDVETGGAQGAIQSVASWLNNLADETVYVNVQRRQLGGVQKFTASGGIFSGAQERIIAEDGDEAVVPLNRPLGQVDPAVRWLSAVAQGIASPAAAPPMRAQAPMALAGTAGRPERIVIERVVERMPRQVDLVVPGMGRLMATVADRRIDNDYRHQDRWDDHD